MTLYSDLVLVLKSSKLERDYCTETVACLKSDDAILGYIFNIMKEAGQFLQPMVNRFLFPLIELFELLVDELLFLLDLGIAGLHLNISLNAY